LRHLPAQLLSWGSVPVCESSKEDEYLYGDESPSGLRLA
jgi:hypothetical protein